VDISDNVFTDVCLSSMYQFCDGIISICPVVPLPETHKPYHKNIRITGNVFDSPGTPVLYAFSCSGLIFTGNRIFRSPGSDPWHPGSHTIRLEYCRDSVLRDNLSVGPSAPDGAISTDHCENILCE